MRRREANSYPEILEDSWVGFWGVGFRAWGVGSGQQVECFGIGALTVVACSIKKVA